MKNIIKCQRCSKTLIDEEFESHYCHPHFKDVRSIVVDWHVRPKIDENGDMVSLWKGLDGIIYRLIECKHNPPHQPKVNTNNTTDKETEPVSGCCTIRGTQVD